MVRSELFQRLSDYKFIEIEEINSILNSKDELMVPEKDLMTIWELINIAIDRNESSGREPGLIELYAVEAELSILFDRKAMNYNIAIQ